MDIETIFMNPNALGFDFIPKFDKYIKYREKEQDKIISSIRPLMHERDGRNIFFFGKPGIGKTLAAKSIHAAIDDPMDDAYGDVSDMVYPVFINCWQKNTSFKVIEEICFQVGFKFTQNKKTDELFKALANIINRKSAVFFFDEIDKVQDMDFLYTILEQIYRKSIILITNHKDFVLTIEDRVKSRLAPDIIEFKPYNLQETRGILEERKKYAFRPNTWDEDAFSKVVQAAYEAQDIRQGLHIMKEAGENAEDKLSRKITAEHVEKALGKAGEMSVKNTEDLDEESRFILKIVKDNSGQKIGDLFKTYQEIGGKGSYKTFQRKIQKLSEGSFVNAKKVTGGTEGSTTIVNYLRTKKLSEF